MSSEQIATMQVFLGQLAPLNSHDRKMLHKRMRWLKSKISVQNMTNAPLFQEEYDATRKALELSEQCRIIKKALSA